MNTFFNALYWGNALKDWLIALFIASACVILLNIFKRRVLLRLHQWSEKSDTTLDDFFIAAIQRSVLPLLYFFALYAGLSYLDLSPKVTQVIKVVLLLVGTFYVVRLLIFMIEYFVYGFLRKHEISNLKKKQARGVIIIVNLVLWITGFVFLLDNLGYNVTTVIAGLGISGIAIALAAQAILGDLFSYFVIFFDKPFEIGDFITVDDKMGTIEYVGLKTTRVRALSGEQLIFSNTNLTNARVHNHKRMEKRRAVFTISVNFETPAETLKKIPVMVKNIILSQPDLEYDRGHMLAFGHVSFNFEFVYFVTNPDYNVYMDRQQAISFSILDLFEKEKIRLA